MSEPTLYDRIHEIDLRDRERIVKLRTRLEAELNSYDAFLQAIALAEGKLDHYRVGLLEGQDIDEAKITDTIETLQRQQEEQLKSIKAAVFGCSNDLKQLHERRKIVQAQSKEIEELAAEEAVFIEDN